MAWNVLKPNSQFCPLPFFKKRDPGNEVCGIPHVALILRTVPTIVSAHTSCASRKSWFKRALRLTLTQSTTLLMKAKFSYCDQIKFNEPVLKLGTPE